MRKFLLTLSAVLLISSAFAQVVVRTFLEDENRVPRERFVDMQHLKLEVSFEPEKGLVKGKVEHQFTVLQKSVDHIELDAINMDIKSIKMGEEDLKYEYNDKIITIQFETALVWKSNHTLSITYEATPRKGLYFVGWNDPNNLSKKQIWSQGQGIDNRHWIPMFDDMTDKVISEMLVTMPEQYQVLSNGILKKSKSLKGGNKLWNYEISHPHAPYLIMLGIGEYEIEKRKSTSGVEMSLYYYKGEQNKVEPTYRHSVAMFDFFEEKFGVAYPWETYAQIPVQEFMYGAMENTTATIFGDFYLVDSNEFLDRNYVRVNAHELAHQWFGDMVTARTTTHAWLQESFATHFDMTYQGEAFGKDYFDFVRRGYIQQSLDASNKDLRPIAHSQAGTVRHYPKGALVLYMLKNVVGEEQFFSTIQYYLKKHAYGTVDTEDFLIAFQENLGLSLDWFWEQWVMKGGEPHYKVNFEELENEYRFEVKQIHERNELVGLFKMPIQFEVHFKDGSKVVKTEWIENESHSISLPKEESKKVDFVLFDPNNEIIKAVTFNKPLEQLKAQATNAPNAVDRYEALIELRGVLTPAEVARMFEKETSTDVKSELVIHAMMDLSFPENYEVFSKAFSMDDVEVHKTILNNTIIIDEVREHLYVSLLSSSSNIIAEKALDLLCFYRLKDVDKYLELSKSRIGNRSKNVRIKWLEWSYMTTQNEDHLDELISYLSNSYEFITRTNAAAALERMNVMNEQGITHLIDGLFSPNSRLRGPLNGTVKHFYNQTMYQLMIRNVILSNDWSEKELNTLKKFLVH
ncbi:M1 family metallopeptidase [Acidiluteibacter ferrifornacis]|uniref:Aminopeptidase N n=1 Tax=Acidiluteibacter ferrifornacis TaxID=2692424 RepID=A0A6N9NL44_9FLAO|nr:M1 family metallopeptidase [Acidiluteibacter ferrifornacis]NBG65305.1 hypothetical protein [Acidiluteibacter ferrifornacis]